MRLTKAFGLAAIAAVAALAFIGTSSAAAAGEVVLCKELVTTCPAGSQWPSGTTLLYLWSNAELLGVLRYKCEDATITSKTTALSGSPLPFELTAVAFGKLPTPTLGEGCTGCPTGNAQVHVNKFFNGNVSVTAADKYSLTFGLKVTLLCRGFTCGYIKEAITSPITHDGTHPNMSGTNLPRVHILTNLTINLGTEFFCGSTAQWEGDYIIFQAENGATSGLAWPALN